MQQQDETQEPELQQQQTPNQGPQLLDVLKQVNPIATTKETNSTTENITVISEENIATTNDGYESSDLSSSSDSDDSVSMEDTENDRRDRQNELLAFIADGDNDDDAMDAGANNTDAVLATKHEVLNPEIPQAPISELPETASMSVLGKIHSIVDANVIIEGMNSGEQKILDSDSIVAFADRKVLGLIFDIFGPVLKPLYSVRFNNAEDIDREKAKPGTLLYYSPGWSKVIDTNHLKVNRGTDASNEYDEEVGSDDMEFSDDEKEMAYRRSLKTKRRNGATGGRFQRQQNQQRPQENRPGAVVPQQQQQQQQQSVPPPPSQAGRQIRSYGDLYDPDLGF